MSELFLVLGGNGFIGYSVVKELVKQGKRVRCVDYMSLSESYRFCEVEYYVGDIRDKSFLKSMLKNVYAVLDFVSTTMPNTNDVSIISEIDNTLKYHDYILSTMYTCGVFRYVFPSSGGAIYGNKNNEMALETDVLLPSTPYGVGKKMTETLIEYYYNKCGISTWVFRIGNVYGSPKYRSKAQGVVDIFIQNILQEEKVVIWGGAEKAVRDYIFLDDVSEVIVDTIQKRMEGVAIYNIGTGRGTNLFELIDIIGNTLEKEVLIDYEEGRASGINCIVLSPDKIFNEIGWRAKVSLEEGIKRTADMKRKLLNIKND